ncbi:hypothetical protein HDU79_002789 [Rhizoclosmatium sp. JEL0117]|nr:hypothetical protein HDU79_002789 [Rhizoclosmatium sp. JEL0117]
MSTPELGSLLEEDELNSRSGSPHSSDSSSYISSDLFSSDDSGDESGNKSNASSDFGSLPEIAGRTASQTLLIAKQNTTKLGKLHRKKAPGLQKGGLEQETVLAFPWKRTRNLIHALGVQKKMAHSPNRKHRKAVKKGLRIGTLSGSFPDVKAPRVSMAAGAAAKVDKARAAVFAGVLSARVKELEFRKKGRGSFRVSTVSENSELRDSNESISGIMELVDAPLSRNLTVPFADIREVEPDENLGLEEEEEEEEEDLGDEKSGPILPITIPHGFQLLRTLVQPKPCVKSVINVSANNTDSFAVLDTYQARLIRGTMKVAGISVGEEKSVPDSHLTGLNRWIFISKWRITIIATLHLELKVLGLSLELLSQVSSVKPVLCLDFHDARDELIAGGVGNIRIWTVSQLKGTYRLSGPRLIIDDLQSEEWITHIVHNAYLNRLMVACDCDLLVGMQPRKSI